MYTKERMIYDVPHAFPWMMYEVSSKNSSSSSSSSSSVVVLNLTSLWPMQATRVKEETQPSLHHYYHWLRTTSIECNLYLHRYYDDGKPWAKYLSKRAVEWWKENGVRDGTWVLFMMRRGAERSSLEVRGGDEYCCCYYYHYSFYCYYYCHFHMSCCICHHHHYHYYYHYHHYYYYYLPLTPFVPFLYPSSSSSLQFSRQEAPWLVYSIRFFYRQYIKPYPMLVAHSPQEWNEKGQYWEKEVSCSVGRGGGSSSSSSSILLQLW